MKDKLVVLLTVKLCVAVLLRTRVVDFKNVLEEIAATLSKYWYRKKNYTNAWVICRKVVASKQKIYFYNKFIFINNSCATLYNRETVQETASSNGYKYVVKRLVSIGNVFPINPAILQIYLSFL
jgi:V8-like Glu-specific endopeptidase